MLLPHRPLLSAALRLSRSLAFVVGVILAGVTAQAQSTTWAELNHGLNATAYPYLTGVAFGNGVFVVANGQSETGALNFATSTNGTTWTPGSVSTGLTLTAHSRPRFVNGRFILFVVGGRGSGTNVVSVGRIYTSTNGTTWAGADLSFNSLPVEIDYGNDRYVAVGNNGFIVGSADLASWSNLTTPLAGSSFQDVAFGNGRWFITTNGGGAVATSTDGITFTNVTGLAGAAGGYRVEYGNGLWYFYSQVSNAVSTDGTTFTTIARANGIPGGTSTIRALNGRFVGTGINQIAGSLDGRTWSTMGSIAPANSIFTAINDYAYGAGRYVVAGYTQPSFTSTAPAIFTIAEADVPAPATPPTITTPLPATLAAVLGRSATLSITATGSNLTYQWRKDTVAIAGATAATYTIASVSAASAGSYTVVITNSLGTATSTPLVLSIVAAEQAGRIINLSVLTDVATAGDNFTLGYVVGGTGTSGGKPLVIRAAGPSLGALGVAGTLADPKLETFTGSTKTGENDDWGGSATVSAAMTAVGAFPYTGTASKDAAVSASITTRDNSAKVSATGSGTGKVIAEVYDATPATGFTTATPRLLNVSVNKHLGTGVTAGFVLGGATPTRVLIRVVGPGLAAFGVGGTIADPQLALFNDKSAKIAENNDWGGTTELTAAFTSVGAFTLTPTSKDAALLISLAPGLYSVQASGVNNTTGVAIVEVYEVP